jgi:hypothetical protein
MRSRCLHSPTKCTTKYISDIFEKLYIFYTNPTTTVPVCACANKLPGQGAASPRPCRRLVIAVVDHASSSRGITAETCVSGRASFSLSKPPISDTRRKADSDLNTECLMLTGVVAVREKGCAGRICAVYRVVVGIRNTEFGSAASDVR